jgi:oligopeptidase B
LVGATVGRHTEGDLFGFAYTEVPYVDVLRTTTNPKLPLTKLEYEEFGHPAKKLQNFGALLHLSPVDLVPDSGVPRIFVLSRTALLDLEVLAYESMKWIRKLRGPTEIGKDQPKLLAITAGEGHFAKGPTALRQRAEDLAILDAWTSASRKKSKTRRGLKGTRRVHRNH